MDDTLNTQIVLITTIIHILTFLCLILDMETQQRRQQRRAHWVCPMLQKRGTLGYHNTLLVELAQNDPSHYRNFMRMDVATFEDLLSQVQHDLLKENTR